MPDEDASPWYRSTPLEGLGLQIGTGMLGSALGRAVVGTRRLPDLPGHNDWAQVMAGHAGKKITTPTWIVSASSEFAPIPDGGSYFMPQEYINQERAHASGLPLNHDYIQVRGDGRTSRLAAAVGAHELGHALNAKTLRSMGRVGKGLNWLGAKSRDWGGATPKAAPAARAGGGQSSGG